MNSNEIFHLMYQCLSSDRTPEIRCITKGEKKENHHPIHLHDEFEVRMLLSADGSRLDWMDITAPRICHRSLSPEENEHAHVLRIDDNVSFYQHRFPGSHQSFSSPYKAQLLQRFHTLAKDPESPVCKEECRLLLALFYLTASSAEDGAEKIGDRIQKYAQYLRSYSYRQDLSVADTAKIFGFSPRYIQQVFRAVYTLNPKEYLLKIRMENAAKLLSEQKYYISEIASLCGFSNAHYFSMVFHRYYGESPRFYINKKKLHS